MAFWQLIVKNLMRRRVRSSLSALGVAIAVAAAVALISFSTGFERSCVEVYSGRGVDMVVVRAGVTERLTSSLNEKIAEQLAEFEGVAAVNPSLTDMVSFGEGSLVGVPVHGWPVDSFEMVDLEMTSGRRHDPQTHLEVVLGSKLATSLKKKVGDKVEIEAANFEVVGIFRGLNVFEDATAVVRLDDLQRLMDRAGQVTEFQLKLKPSVAEKPSAVSELSHRIAARKLPPEPNWGCRQSPRRSSSPAAPKCGWRKPWPT